MSSFKYYASIDGLRMIAVCSVMLFHASPNLLPGGFVGVDIFFVISGYLITRILVTDIEAGEFSAVEFYQRRIARIFPVFLLVTATTLWCASKIYTPQDFASAGAVATTAAFSMTNFKLMMQGNYFEVSTDAQPFLHYWSLAIEEQFYLLLPAFLVVAKRIKISTKGVTRLLLITMVCSAATGIALTYWRPVWGFYLLPARAWEMLAGSILATVQYTQHQQSEANRSTTHRTGRTGIIGCFLLLGAFLFIREGQGFPGFVAVVPVLGAVMLIASSDNHNVTTRMLSNPLLVFVGKISYSLYLWHWPIFCFVEYALFDQPGILRFSLKLLATICVSTLCYLLFESPLRSVLTKRPARWSAYLTFAVGVLAIAFVGTEIRRENYVNASASEVIRGGLIFNFKLAEPRLTLMGDSNGSMYGVTLRDIGIHLKARTSVISVAAGNPLPNSKQYMDSIAFLKKEKPTVTVFALAWAKKLEREPELLKKQSKKFSNRLNSLC